ncbi:Uncharacterised protein [Mycobacterium tuberculosis]|uniref:Uncharacterized protein n=1 Tax=Mycobacterium tuberculosis TaxID=1773 RepID=A0A655JLN4_MYCTX|nr:Uncharacterised protein [Mycobacterium tuberculosis]COX12335.1 Uncharacterised protein [Mycobacterium tuberculosis]
MFVVDSDIAAIQSPACGRRCCKLLPEEFRRAHQDLHAGHGCRFALLFGCGHGRAQDLLRGVERHRYRPGVPDSNVRPGLQHQHQPAQLLPRPEVAGKLHRPDARQVPQRGHIVHSTRSPLRIEYHLGHIPVRDTAAWYAGRGAQGLPERRRHAPNDHVQGLRLGPGLSQANHL